MLSPIDQYFAGQMQALDLRAQRGELLASNVANADTPNYKARDFDFAAALGSAMTGALNRGGPLRMERTAPAHLMGGGGQRANVDLKYRIPTQSSIDGNTVELDTELGQFSDNAIRYQADLAFMTNKIRGLQVAITGQ